MSRGRGGYPTALAKAAPAPAPNFQKDLGGVKPFRVPRPGPWLPRPMNDNAVRGRALRGLARGVGRLIPWLGRLWDLYDLLEYLRYREQGTPYMNLNGWTAEVDCGGGPEGPYSNLQSSCVEYTYIPPQPVPGYTKFLTTYKCSFYKQLYPAGGYIKGVYGGRYSKVSPSGVPEPPIYVPGTVPLWLTPEKPLFPPNVDPMAIPALQAPFAPLPLPPALARDLFPSDAGGMERSYRDYGRQPAVSQAVGVSIGPNSISQIRPETRLAPARPSTKERKAYVTAKWHIAEGLIGFATEATDAIDAVFKALPYKYRSRRGRKYPFTNQEKLERLWKHWDKVDLGEAANNLAMNELKDRFFGKVGRELGKQARRHGLPHGFQLGPAL